MDDFDKFIEQRKRKKERKSTEFAQNYDSGYEQFKIGVFLKQA